jgi:hypothetical protein
LLRQHLLEVRGDGAHDVANDTQHYDGQHYQRDDPANHTKAAAAAAVDDEDDRLVISWES